jgi:hypothetical protein
LRPGIAKAVQLELPEVLAMNQFVESGHVIQMCIPGAVLPALGPTLLVLHGIIKFLQVQSSLYLLI